MRCMSGATQLLGVEKGTLPSAPVFSGRDGGLSQLRRRSLPPPQECGVLRVSRRE